MAGLWPLLCRRRPLFRVAGGAVVFWYSYPSAQVILEVLERHLAITGAVPGLDILVAAVPALVAASSPLLAAVLITLAAIAAPSLLARPPDRTALLIAGLLVLDGTLFRCEEARWEGRARLECRVPLCRAAAYLLDAAVALAVLAAAYALSGVPRAIVELYVRLGDGLPADTSTAWRALAGSPPVRTIVYTASVGVLLWVLLALMGWVRVLAAGTAEDARALLDRIVLGARDRIRRAREWYHVLYRLAALYLVSIPGQLAWALYIDLAGRGLRPERLLAYWVADLLVVILVGYRLTRNTAMMNSMALYKYAILLMAIALLPLAYAGAVSPGSILSTLRGALEGRPPSGPGGGAIGEDVYRILEYFLRALLSS